MSRMVFIALVVAFAATAMADGCGGFMTCQTCVDQPYCGWCSTDVVYPDGKAGPQCAGFSKNGSTPFACNGIYSTESCTSGYECDMENFQCKKTAPGKGITKEACEANCTNEGQVFLCNHTSKKCYQVPKNTPGATSMSVCEASCIHPSHHPSSPHPASPVPSHLYTCNFTTGQCVVAPAGKGSSKGVCESSCKKSNGTKYTCNSFLHTCKPVAEGQPGYSKEECDTMCNPKPKPGPPSRMKTGLYRGIEVNVGYKTGEFDLDINTTKVTMVTFWAGQTPVTVTGKPFHVPGSKDPELVIELTSGPDSGKTIRTISFTSGTRGPETAFMAIAFGAAGGAAPSSISSAWTTGGQTVYAMARCISADCVFKLNGTGVGIDGEVESEIAEVVRAVVSSDTPVDPCMQWSQSCTECLSHQYCGWCSTNVSYKDGTEGTQCAGFNPNGSTSPFVCSGQYSTLQCNVGYKCDNSTWECTQTTPGNGLPKDQCDALCKPTPPPTPPPQQYVCNTTLKQCFKCNETHCPGSLPQGPCMAACVHPKHGPHAALIGNWRGIQIQPGYMNIEIDLIFTNETLSVYIDSKLRYTGNITSYGADAMLVHIIEGENKGWTYGAQYQFESQDNEYEMLTVAKGILGQSFPASFDEAMTTPGMECFVMAKCQGAPCNFLKP